MPIEQQQQQEQQEQEGVCVRSIRHAAPRLAAAATAGATVVAEMLLVLPTTVTVSGRV